MLSIELLTDAFNRIQGTVRSVLSSTDAAILGYRPDPESNSVAWLVWHLTRVQDDHVSEVAGIEQVWTAGGWADRFNLPFDVSATGYGQSSAEAGAVQVSAELLAGYHRAVHAQTIEFLGGLSDADFDRVVDTSWSPPVTLGVRLVSVISDDLQHAGQAAYVRGLAIRALRRG
ncbi:mycothiol transferase [Glaciibacter sp. 2TAF33]|uniref:mycothiol transferase n=1 Tax=Glaciibacter sp. 2TAF33 TaxID=3233015 RepID=UPI003F90AF3C